MAVRIVWDSCNFLWNFQINDRQIQAIKIITGLQNKLSGKGLQGSLSPKGLQGSSSPIPGPAQGISRSHNMCLRAWSMCFWNCFRLVCGHSLASLFQCPATLCAKKIFLISHLNLPSLSFMPFRKCYLLSQEWRDQIRPSVSHDDVEDHREVPPPSPPSWINQLLALNLCIIL